MRYGGLNGWATTSRCGVRASTAISVMPKPDVDDATTTCSGVAASIAASRLRLSVQLLGRALLHDVGIGDGGGEVGRDGQVVHARARRQPQLGERGPRRVDEAAQPRLGVRRRVPGAHGEPAGQEVRHPAAADDPGAHAGDGAHLVGRDAIGHLLGRSARISRASSGVATSAPIAVMIVTALATSSALVTLLPRPR